MHPNGGRIYGGQLLAQALDAASKTVDTSFVLHSQQANFISPGNGKCATSFEVERVRDGGQFCLRRVVAKQQGAPIFSSSLSFQRPSEGVSIRPSMPDVPPPETLESNRTLALQSGLLNEDFMVTTGEDLDVRVIDPFIGRPLTSRPPELKLWIRVNGRLSNRQQLHKKLLAYMSDVYLGPLCLLPTGLSPFDPSVQSASLDHAMWFHEPVRADEWHLHTIDAEQAGSGLGLARGRFYCLEGRLVASVMQQALVRLLGGEKLSANDERCPAW